MSDAASMRLRDIARKSLAKKKLDQIRLRGQGVFDVETVFISDHPPDDPSIEALVDNYTPLLRGLAELLELK
jgi:hypothetical protein